MVHAKYPAITVQLQTASFPDYWTKLPSLAASHRLPDIISLQSERTAGFAQLVAPLDPMIAHDRFDLGAFDRSIIAGLSLNGHIYALPYDFGPMIMYYNRDQFAAAGLPAPKSGWTNAEFVKDAKTLTKDGRFGAVQSVPDAFCAYATSDGAAYLAANGDPDLTNPKLAAAFQDYVDLVARDHAAPVLPSSGSPSMAQANGRFVAGDAAMYVDGPWDLINVRNSIKFHMGLAPIPAGSAGSVTITAGSGFGVSASSQHKEQAWQAVQVLTGPEAERYLAENGRAFPARLADQTYWYSVAGKDVENAKPAMQAALSNAVPYRTSANWNVIDGLFGQYAPLAFAGRQPAGDVLKTIQQSADE
ncbi:ABC transporter substrate-binding protein [Lichenicoccus sp.]|uniref:ABC transporter substrate-binding protein n=1 Tax=Lichenicoccus sp. TaxID=2781899 RepID=UPI003D0BA826